ncbi:MAG TPA: MerR family transcriptional regulator [Verrucomicrobiae bacterium]|jgi:DNA-binding transcriptional MerR regulator/quercetin dioxygenase-like cupin family protein
MAYTVKQLAAISSVSVRALHFYDETGLLKPAYLGANGYRFYEEPQLLTLQQILFYRELDFELKQIKQILGRANFEKIAALRSHRKVLQKNLARTLRLIETIDKTIKHLKGTKPMKSQEMFEGFRVGAGEDRFGEHVKLGGEPNDRKVSAKDTDGAMCIFEFTGVIGWPRHLHHDQDEWVYIIDGEFEFHVAKKKFHVQGGECVFIPRNVAHVWRCANSKPGKIINVYQPAGKMEEFFREVGKHEGKPAIHEALGIDGLHQLFETHGMHLLGPPIGWDEYLAAQSPAIQDHWKMQMQKTRKARTA